MKKNEEPESKRTKCFCPYCDEELVLPLPPYCQPCRVTLRYCMSCHIAVKREATVCPQCGGKLEWK